jgi:hypothetical protein
MPLLLMVVLVVLAVVGVMQAGEELVHMVPPAAARW